MLSKAIALTSQGRLDEARALYEQLSRSHPAEGLPAYARFLRLTGREKELDQLLKEAKTGDAKSEKPGSQADLLTRARTLVEGGDSKEAAALLRSDALALSGEQTTATLFLAQLLHAQNLERERTGILLSALADCPTTPSRAQLFGAIVSGDTTLLQDHPTSLLLAMELGLRACSPRRVRAAEWADPIFLEIQNRPDYRALREEILRQAPGIGLGAIWTAARLLIREERHPEALELIEKSESLGGAASGASSGAAAAALGNRAFFPLLLEEKADLLRTAGRRQESEAILRALAAKQSGLARARTALEAARAALGARPSPQPAQALDLLRSFSFEILPADERRLARMAMISAAAKLGQFDQIMNVYAANTRWASLEEAESAHSIIFQEINDTPRCRALETAIRKRMAEDARADASLWRLAAAAARESRLKPNELEALYQYARARPEDLTGFEALAKAVAPIAAEIATAPANVIAVPKEEVAKLQELAEKSMREIIRAKPYEPESYAQLIHFYTAKGQKEAAAKAPDAPLAGTKDPKALGVAGYALAINGYPKEALAYYDRALALGPENMEVQMNRAACLTRLDRWDEAEAYYHQILEKGFHGHPFHVHEMVIRLWNIAEHLKCESKTLDYFRGAFKQLKGGWRIEAHETLVAILMDRKRWDAAREFLEPLRAEDIPAGNRQLAWEALGNIELNNRQFAAAVKIFEKAAETFKEAGPEMALSFRQMAAEATAAQGKVQEAIERYRELARRNASSAPAQEGLYRAGLLAQKAKNAALASELFKEFLEAPRGDFSLKRKVGDFLAGKIDSLEAPSTSTLAPANMATPRRPEPG